MTVLGKLSPSARRRAQVARLRARAKGRSRDGKLRWALGKAYGGSRAEYEAAISEASVPGGSVRRFDRFGYVAQRKSLRFHAAARRADLPDGPVLIGTGGARGGAKSHTTFAQVALDDCQRVPGMSVLFLRKVGKAAQVSLEQLCDRVLHSIDHKLVGNTVRFPNGSTITAGHFQRASDIDQYLGLEYDVIVLEEATTLEERRFDMVRGSLRTSREGWRPRMYLTTNPGGVGHKWFKQRIVTPHLRGTQTSTFFVPSTVYDNAFVDPGYVAFLETLTGWMRKAWLLGDWNIAAGQYFSTWRDGVHAIEPRFGRIPVGYTVWASMDYGFTHYTATYLHARSTENVIFTLDEHLARKQQPETVAVGIKSMLSRWGLRPDSLRRFVAGGDIWQTESSGSNVAAKYRKAGIRLRRANMARVQGAQQVLSRLGDPDEGVAPSWFVFAANCPRLVETIPLMEHNPNRPEDVRKVDVDDDGRGGDDPYDGARYGLMEYPDADRRMRRGTIDWHAPAAAAINEAPQGRSEAEVEEMLEAYG